MHDIRAIRENPAAFDAAMARRAELMERMEGGLAVITSADRSQPNRYEFYVDDTEIQSKIFLEGMVAAYSSRVGSKGAQDEGPPVVLAVGGS